MKTTGIGVIGTGGRGHHAWLAHQPENGWEILMGADIREEANAEFREKFPHATTTDDYRKVLADPRIEVVFIMTPDYLHEEMALAALEAGKHIYLEKPMAITIEGCDRILETARRTGSRLFVGHNMRYFPAILKMKEIVDSGLIGDIQVGWCRHFINYGGDAYFRDWHSERKNTTGLLLQKGAHDIDVMHFIMGTYTRDVVGMGMLSVYDRCARRSPDTPGCAAFNDEQWPPLEQTGFSPIIDVEDHNMIMMQMANGAQATYLQCHYTPDAERNYTFIGTRGRVENIGDSGDCEIHVWTRRGPRKTPDIIHHLKPLSGTHGGSDPQVVDNFLAFVRDGAPTNANPVAARNSVAVGVLGHESMRNGNQPRHIPALAPDLAAYFEEGQKTARKTTR